MTFEQLHSEASALFGSARFESGQVVIACPVCHHRGHTPDVKGHLRLNAPKLAGYCVRCGYKIQTGTLGEWMRKRGANLPFSDGDFLTDSARSRPSYIPYIQTVELPKSRPLLSCRESKAYRDLTQEKGLTDAEIRFFDLRIIREGWLREWQLFPFREGGGVCYWQARNPDPNCKVRKYNPNAQNDQVELGKSFWLYNLDLAQPNGRAIIVEGTLDCISVQSLLLQTGMYLDKWYVVAVNGTTMSFPTGDHKNPWESQVGKLLLIEPELVVVLFDEDASHPDGPADRLASALSLHGVDAMVAQLPIPCDPNELFQTDPTLLHQTLMQAIQPSGRIDGIINSIR